MRHQTRQRLKRLWQITMVIVAAVSIFVMYDYSSRVNIRNHTYLHEKADVLERLAIRQSALTAFNFLSAGDHDSLQTLVDNLSNEPLILDATIYDASGLALIRSEYAMPLEQVTGLATPLSIASFGRKQIIEPIAGNHQLLGFLRITLEQGNLLNDADAYLDHGTKRVRTIIIAALVIGAILGFSFRKKMFGNKAFS
ncbi:YtjB family periplasmic protein [Parasalinivibrio latis]|uniref:AhpA/YtjB family protein n=1 Tax=Parasalinivibrio latis TaxID=2952610 RepID=UPI0030DFCA41